MTIPDRPNLSLDVLFQIEVAQNKIHLQYHHYLEQMQMPTDEAEAERLKLHPAVKFQPPMLKSPQMLRKLLSQYATSLFDSEADFFPNDAQLRPWLGKLAERIQRAVIGTVVRLQTIGVAKKVTLMYHGVAYDDMRETLKDTLNTAIEYQIRGRIVAQAKADAPVIMQRPQSEIDAEQKLYNETARHLMGVRQAEQIRELSKPKRLPSTITSLPAARRVEAYIQQNGIGLTEFATRAGTTDRTLRSFRKTGKIRRSLFEGIARAMGITKEKLLS